MNVYSQVSQSLKWLHRL